MSEPVRRALPPSVFARLADAGRYVITGVSPDTWFGPLQPLEHFPLILHRILRRRDSWRILLG
jgi:hypothetical protein